MSAADPYQTLGVARTASQDDIRKAYRSLAKKYHPDLNPGDKEAEEKFKAVSRANDLLSDEAQRGRYDRGEIDAAGQERAPPGYGANGGYRDFAEGAHGSRYGGGAGAEGFSQDDLGDIFGNMFGNRGGGFNRRPAGPERGPDRSYSLTVSFIDSVLGTTSRVSLPDGSTLDVKIPPGIEDGQVLRLRGKGGEGSRGGATGDALITITITPDVRYTREGRDLRERLPVDVRTAVLGGPITVPTPSGSVRMNVPAGSDTGAVLRLRGRGVKEHGKHPAGNLYVTLEVHIGKVDDKFREFLKNIAPAPDLAEATDGESK
ncbi:DnaJ C-terminal domain-containing protein [Acetobacter oeni]|uniref:Molecular chaperone DnaJ n=1 Tax=Acetobacter oeni TaxID=304077 RepID=A0A511XJZ5_9PROT|nr:J domain-containing protein [Acetobacter oeni]MBB3883467.1 DnaJ-class molecular chaperone [Acetobacter oeni]NHO19437.1 DnaJ domain-containing protein [Acetobacter oeni]GBR04080.1 molecular chaperone DnaJ [Acetobacter oeni LMG 21952]GEN63248.1 molecular chaperone DnaJ [Acetobacter oeni]